MGFRVGLNVADSGVIDVGYAGVVGADRIAHGEPIYDNFPDDVSQGDTYGPVNYLAYVPFERIWPWSGELGRPARRPCRRGLLRPRHLRLPDPARHPHPPRTRGQRLAAILAFGWAAYPYTAYALESNSNDTLVAALLVATLLVAARPLARGSAARRWRPGPSSPRWRRALSPRCSWSLRARPPTARALVSFVARLRRLVDGALRDGLAGDRPGPEDVLRPHDRHPGRPRLAVQHLGPGPLAGTAAHRARSPRPALSRSLFAFVPRRKSLVQVAALSAALLIALQLTLHHWFYLYIVWLFPLLLVAMAALETAGALRARPEPAPSPARTSQPAPAG